MKESARSKAFHVGFGYFTVVTIKTAIFGVITPCGMIEVRF
jgi:hypothetical protein